MYSFMSYMQIQNDNDEYAKYGKDLKNKIERLTGIKDVNFSAMALENQSIVGEEEGAPN